MRDRQPPLSRRARPVLHHPSYRPPTSGVRRIVRFLTFLAALGVLILILASGAFFYLVNRPVSSDSRTLSVRVATGESVTELATRLQSLGVIDNPLLFRLDARLRGLASELKVGNYPLRRNMSIDQVVGALAVYKPQVVSITIPEGLRMEQIAQILQQNGISATEFLRLARHPSGFSSPILAGKPAGATLEGYLFPNTYDVPPHYSARMLISLMLKTLDSQFTPAMRAAARREHLSVRDTLTMASIVEREARMASERPTIASVYLNRLRLPMKLDADPTVQYALANQRATGGTVPNWWPDLTQADYQSVVSPYNTYLNAGLPPGPIANPGLASIRAVVHPARTNYLYFVAKGNGYHAFASTYQQQLLNEQKYQHP